MLAIRQEGFVVQDRGGRMICYRDRCYCMCRDCKHYESCPQSEHQGMIERNLHPDEFVRNLPMCVADMSKRCDEYEVAE